MCGALRYRTQGLPVKVVVCHCKFCQAGSSSFFSVLPLFRADQFTWLTGTPKSFDASRDERHKGFHEYKHFCQACGVTMRIETDGHVGVCGGTYDKKGWYANPAITVHTFTANALAHSLIPSGVATFHFKPSNSPVKFTERIDGLTVADSALVGKYGDAPPHQGSCPCGKHKFVMHSSKVAFMMYCRCLDCQMYTGAISSTFINVTPDNHEWTTATEPAHFDMKADSGRSIVRHFCDTCGTTVMMEYSMFHPKKTVGIGLFKQPNWLLDPNGAEGQRMNWLVDREPPCFSFPPFANVVAETAGLK